MEIKTSYQVANEAYRTILGHPIVNKTWINLEDLKEFLLHQHETQRDDEPIKDMVLVQRDWERFMFYLGKLEDLTHEYIPMKYQMQCMIDVAKENGVWKE